MRFLVAFIAAICVCEAKPAIDMGARATFGGEPYIIGGADATPGAWPWQLSQQRLGTTWSHSCGASLLSARYALSASHCVDGADASILRVIAGLHDRSNEAGTQTSNIVSYKMHEDYNIGPGTYSDDIAILTLEAAVVMGGNVQAAVLPADNSNQLVNQTVVITGWGRTGISNQLPNILQQASLRVTSTAECTQLFASVSGTVILDSHLCLYDNANAIGSCNGDSGGPANYNGGSGYMVVGVTSWGVSGPLGGCRQNYPSVYTRVSSFLDWITTNTP